MYQIGQPKNQKKVITKDGLNKDIITAIHNALPEAIAEVKEFSKNFKGKNNLETSRKIWNYLRSLKYVKDPQGFQYIKLPKKLINSSGDCKSFSLLTGAILKNLGLPVTFRYTSYDINDPTPSHIYTITKDENGKDIIIDGVFYEFNAEVPYKHKKDYKMEIAVINGLNAPLVTRLKKGSFNPNAVTVEFLQRSLSKVKPSGFLFTLINNEIARQTNKPNKFIYSDEQLQKYLRRLKNRKSLVAQNSWIARVLQNEINAIEQNRFTGVIKLVHTDKELNGIEDEIGKLSLKKIGKKLKKVSLKNIWKGVKKVGLAVPRKAFLSLVFLNVRGLAKRLSRFNPAELETVWVKNFGGKLSAIKKAIEKGKKKRALFGQNKRLKQIKGIGYIVYSGDQYQVHPIGATIEEGGTSSGSGAATVATAAAATTAAATAAAANPAGATSVASIIAAAAPILIVVAKALKKAGIPEEVDPAAAAGEITTDQPADFSDATSTADASNKSFMDYAKDAIKLAETAGIIPDKPTTATEDAVNNAITSNDIDGDKEEENVAEGVTDEGSGTVKKILPIAAAALVGAYFLFKKK